jgi:hypothetical protein
MRRQLACAEAAASAGHTLVLPASLRLPAGSFGLGDTDVHRQGTSMSGLGAHEPSRAPGERFEASTRFDAASGTQTRSLSRSIANEGLLTRPGTSFAYGTALVSGQKGGGAGGGPTPHAPYAPPPEEGLGLRHGHSGRYLEDPVLLPETLVKVRAAAD